MLHITISEKGGDARQEAFDKDEVTIGRIHGNDIVLPKGNISKKHSRIVIKDGKFILVDLKSTNGTYVNGKKISAPQVVKSSDRIYIGDFTLQLEAKDEAASAQVAEAESDDEAHMDSESDEGLDREESADLAPRMVQEKRPSSVVAPRLIDESFDQELDADADADPDADEQEKAEPVSVSGAEFAPEVSVSVAKPRPAPVEVEQESKWQPKLSAEVRSATVAKAQPVSVDVTKPETRARTGISREDAVAEIHAAVVARLGLTQCPPEKIRARLQDIERESTTQTSLWWRVLGAQCFAEESEVAQSVVQRFLAIEPLIDLIASAAVTEIVIGADRKIYKRSATKLESTGRTLESADAVYELACCLGSLGGLQPRPAEPYVDVRLADGARVVAVLPPAAVGGPNLSYRKTIAEAFNLAELCQHGVLSDAMSQFLTLAVQQGQNILVSVGRGLGAASLVNALLGQVPEREQILCLECDSELDLRNHPHAVTLHCANSQARHQALAQIPAFAPERLVLTGCFASDSKLSAVTAFAQAAGSIASISARTPQGALEALAEGLPSMLALRSVDLVVQLTRGADGMLRVTEIAEPHLSRSDELSVQTLFRFKPSRLEEGDSRGRFVATGVIPHFVDELTEYGEAIDLSIFKS